MTTAKTAAVTYQKKTRTKQNSNLYRKSCVLQTKRFAKFHFSHYSNCWWFELVECLCLWVFSYCNRLKVAKVYCCIRCRNRKLWCLEGKWRKREWEWCRLVWWRPNGPFVCLCSIRRLLRRRLPRPAAKTNIKSTTASFVFFFRKKICY